MKRLLDRSKSRVFAVLDIKSTRCLGERKYFFLEISRLIENVCKELQSDTEVLKPHFEVTVSKLLLVAVSNSIRYTSWQ